MREIILDTETTGLSPADGHRLVSIGCVEMVDKMLTGADFYRVLNPERSVPREAMEVHGFDDEFLAGQPTFATIARELMAFIAESQLVIHNASFDMSFLNMELRRAGHSPIPDSHAFDTLDLARKKFPYRDNSLDGLCRRFGVDNSDRGVHGALKDARLLASVYLDLTESRRQKLDLEDAGARQTTDVGPAPPRPKDLPPLLSEEERKRHQAFVSRLGENALWAEYSGFGD